MTLSAKDRSLQTSPALASSPASILRVCACILTYKRPQKCRAALESVLAQTILDDPDFEIGILVVDNDSHRSAENVVIDISKSTPITVRYVVEAGQGIVAGRNRVLEEAQAWDFLALLDDDETAAPNWLERLIRAQREYEADVVTGPVDPVLEATPSWVAEGGFFAPRSFGTGTTPKFVETNNVLISGRLTKCYRFDTRFNTTSGEDTFFFLEIMRDGARVIWCEDARVSESISPARTTAEWIVARARSNANRYTRACLFLRPGLATKLSRVFRALASLFLGVLFWLTSFGSLARKVKARQRIGRFRGTIAGLRGKSHVYYKKGATLT